MHLQADQSLFKDRQGPVTLKDLSKKRKGGGKIRNGRRVKYRLERREVSITEGGTYEEVIAQGKNCQGSSSL